ncbi:hypothetical protein [Klebsiella quasipneumoniae]|uniref:hypothetical protein n=1 Tax=Klebsiella quasipneumoniae TaxID=1463165 RepID=UPI00272F3A89|nr:hypothetical protein [Klebsiella quasipneumoniae]MDP1050878.1 hypothetical protein [Klebsiella quasipneumoniae]
MSLIVCDKKGSSLGLYGGKLKKQVKSIELKYCEKKKIHEKKKRKEEKHEDELNEKEKGKSWE